MTPPSSPHHRGGETTAAQGQTQQRAPRLPHERDESADSQAAPTGSGVPSMQRIGRLAQADVERGAPDTSRSVEADQTYHRLRENAPDGTPDEVRP